MRPLTLALVLLALSPAVASAQPEISRSEIIDIAISGVGSPYVWGGACWNPANRSAMGADCSGYVGKCWQIPERSEVTECGSHPYTTSSFLNNRTHWDAINRDELQRADAMVYNSGSAGHVVLWVSGDPWGTSEIYEARGTAYGIVHRDRSFGSEYQPRRRRAIVADGPPPHPVLSLSSEIDTIDGQARDLCTRSGSEGLFDAYVGQTIVERFYVTNEGTDVAYDVVVGLETDSTYLQVLHWEVFDDWAGHSCGADWCPNDANDDPSNPPHATPGESLTLRLSSLSPGETKMLVLELTVVSDSFAADRRPMVRYWVRSVRDYYTKDSYDGTFSNVGGLQTWNGGDLRVSTGHSFLDDEACNGLDDDCSGGVDEGFGVGEVCTVGLGACERQGLTLCSAEGAPSCDAVAGAPTTESCDNGVDDDCDGEVDGDDESCGGDPDPDPDELIPDGGSETTDGGPGTTDSGPSRPPHVPSSGFDELPPPLTGSCACRAAGQRPGSPWPLGLLALVGLGLTGLGRRRRPPQV